jgi:hypothetical protein
MPVEPSETIDYNLWLISGVPVFKMMKSVKTVSMIIQQEI